jgi:hypothetical protein
MYGTSASPFVAIVTKVSMNLCVVVHFPNKQANLFPNLPKDLVSVSSDKIGGG